MCKIFKKIKRKSKIANILLKKNNHLLIKKEFTILGQNDLIKKMIVIITMFILHVRGFRPLGIEPKR